MFSFSFGDLRSYWSSQSFPLQFLDSKVHQNLRLRCLYIHRAFSCVLGCRHINGSHQRLFFGECCCCCFPRLLCVFCELLYARIIFLILFFPFLSKLCTCSDQTPWNYREKSCKSHLHHLKKIEIRVIPLANFFWDFTNGAKSFARVDLTGHKLLHHSGKFWQ